MDFKKCTLNGDLQECIVYDRSGFPLSIFVENFDEYFQREWGCHWHDAFECGIVTRGCANFTIYDGPERTVMRLRQGDGIFIAPGILHSAKGLVPDTVMAVSVLPSCFFGRRFSPDVCAEIEACTESRSFRADDSGSRDILTAPGNSAPFPGGNRTSNCTGWN